MVENTDYKDRLFLKAFTIHNVSLGCVYLTNNHEQIIELARVGTEFMRLFEAGAVKPINY